MENRQDDGFGLPPRFIQQIKKIIKNRMGIRRTEWIELNLETRIILIKEAKYLFNSEMILKFGSKYNYQKDWAKRRGFASYYDYQESKIRENGFENRFDYNTWFAKSNGFKNYYDYQLSRLKMAIIQRIHVDTAGKRVLCPHCKEFSDWYYIEQKTATCKLCRKRFRMFDIKKYDPATISKRKVGPAGTCKPEIPSSNEYILIPELPGEGPGDQF